MRMRKKHRGAQRKEAISALFVEKGFDTDNTFYEKKPLCLEIGCGKGQFIRKLSQRDDAYNYIAIEKVEDVAVIAAEKYASSRNLGGLDPHGAWLAPDGSRFDGERWDIPLRDRGNVRFMSCDATEITDIFAEESIEIIYANFSDPWPKKRNMNRRLTHTDFLKKYLKLLKEGGLFRFKTDNADLFEFSVESVTAEEGFELTFVTRDLHKSERAENNIMTEYETNFSEKGVPINFLEAKKVTK